MYIKVTNGFAEIYSIGKLRKDNPNTSFPKNPSEALLADWDVFPYTEETPLSHDPLTQYLTENFEQKEGLWYKTYTVLNKPQEEAELNIRNQRSILLSETDWMALSDVTLTPEWAAYRQSLRDISSQPGFPYSVTWPTKPS